MCYWWYSFPPSGDCWESFLTLEHTPQPCRKGSNGMLSASDKRGHRGSRLHSRLIVLEALICQESAGNQVGISCLLAASFHVEQRGHSDMLDPYPSVALSCPPPASWRCPDDKTASCLSLPLSLEMSASALSSRVALILCLFYLAEAKSKTNLKYALSHANMRMFGNVFATSCGDLAVCALPRVSQQ